ncbi:carboxymuconolactone decarboxylase family protein [Mycobacterium xenopi 4042]|uniref:Carboxymuconolactone decarboxylase family protein n=1 Tax=Mycobacterium xenopi 4042 TaxID=1299334 RepID=X8ARF1_MYCXE|nr:carboxymuconolactone decarboxylase family protein [Mycobacterium xenopi 4042]
MPCRDLPEFPTVTPASHEDRLVLHQAPPDQTGGRQTATMLEPLRMYAHVPRLLNAYGRLEQASAKLDLLDRRHRALAELKAATTVRCEYCIDLGSQIARRWGLSDEELLALPTYRTAACFSQQDRLVLDYAAAMSRTPVEVSDELVDALRSFFTTAALVELTYVIALENLRARFNLALASVRRASPRAWSARCRTPASSDRRRVAGGAIRRGAPAIERSCLPDAGFGSRRRGRGAGSLAAADP